MTHIWISHEHPDHLHFPTLKAIPAEQKATITLLYQRHFSSPVFESLTSLGFRQVIELPLGRWLDLDGDVSTMCCSVGTIDCLLAVRLTCPLKTEPQNMLESSGQREDDYAGKSVFRGADHPHPTAG